ncbi:MAG: hypothetical protein ABJL67_11405 [Sulfitobacter sp.]
MKLGYMMIPGPAVGQDWNCNRGRAELARDLGFSEFYSADQDGHPFGVDGAPEHADHLNVLTDLPVRPMPKVIAIEGKRQRISDSAAAGHIVRPSVTAQQVVSHAREQKASLSVSWLNKTELAKHWAAHVTGSTHAGLIARPEDWRVARTILVCEDAARAEAAVKSDDSPCRDYYRRMAKPGATSADIDGLIESSVLYGPLQSVLDQLMDISSASGPFGTLALVDHAWQDDVLAQQSLASLVSAIAPVLRQDRAIN